MGEQRIDLKQLEDVQATSESLIREQSKVSFDRKLHKNIDKLLRQMQSASTVSKLMQLYPQATKFIEQLENQQSEIRQHIDAINAQIEDWKAINVNQELSAGALRIRGTLEAQRESLIALYRERDQSINQIHSGSLPIQIFSQRLVDLRENLNPNKIKQVLDFIYREMKVAMGHIQNDMGLFEKSANDEGHGIDQLKVFVKEIEQVRTLEEVDDVRKRMQKLPSAIIQFIEYDQKLSYDNARMQGWVSLLTDFGGYVQRDKGEQGIEMIRLAKEEYPNWKDQVESCREVFVSNMSGAEFEDKTKEARRVISKKSLSDFPKVRIEGGEQKIIAGLDEKVVELQKSAEEGKKSIQGFLDAVEKDQKPEFSSNEEIQLGYISLSVENSLGQWFDFANTFVQQIKKRKDRLRQLQQWIRNSGETNFPYMLSNISSEYISDEEREQLSKSLQSIQSQKVVLWNVEVDELNASTEELEHDTKPRVMSSLLKRVEPGIQVYIEEHQSTEALEMSVSQQLADVERLINEELSHDPHQVYEMYQSAQVATENCKKAEIEIEAQIKALRAIRKQTETLRQQLSDVGVKQEDLETYDHDLFATIERLTKEQRRIVKYQGQLAQLEIEAYTSIPIACAHEIKRAAANEVGGFRLTTLVHMEELLKTIPKSYDVDGLSDRRQTVTDDLITKMQTLLEAQSKKLFASGVEPKENSSFVVSHKQAKLLLQIKNAEIRKLLSEKKIALTKNAVAYINKLYGKPIDDNTLFMELQKHNLVVTPQELQQVHASNLNQEDASSSAVLQTQLGGHHAPVSEPISVWRRMLNWLRNKGFRVVNSILSVFTLRERISRRSVSQPVYDYKQPEEMKEKTIDEETEHLLVDEKKKRIEEGEISRELSSSSSLRRRRK